MIFHISLDPKTARFTDISDIGTWQNSNVVNRGFTNDGDVGQDIKMTAPAKAALLNIQLLQIVQ